MDLLASAAPVEVGRRGVFTSGSNDRRSSGGPDRGSRIPCPPALAVDTSFRTTLQAIVPQSDSWQIDATPDLSRSRYRLRADLDPGVYDVHYLVRSVTPGTF